MHGLKWTTNKPSFSDIIQHTFFFFKLLSERIFIQCIQVRYFRLPPNLAHRKSIDVTNYVTCSTEPPIGSYFHATQ